MTVDAFYFNKYGHKLSCVLLHIPFKAIYKSRFETVPAAVSSKCSKVRCYKCHVYVFMCVSNFHNKVYHMCSNYTYLRITYRCVCCTLNSFQLEAH